MSETLRLFRRLWAFMRREPLDDDLEDELAAHLQFAIDDNIARGMSPTEARRIALISIGGMDQARYKHREARSFMTLDIFKQDLKYTLRTLWRDPSITIVAALILALAIGANIAVFSVVNTLLLRPLPFPYSDQLTWVGPPPGGGLSSTTFSSDVYEGFRDQSRVYQGVTGYFAFGTPDDTRLTSLAVPQAATSLMVVGNFFQVLGVKPALGNLFTPDDGRTGAHAVTLLANHFWRRQFHADPSIVGRE